MEYEVKVSYFESGIKQTITFYKEVSTLYELKQAFLKRFGNMNDAPNKVLKEKALVKKLTHDANNLAEWVRLIDEQTRWELTIREI